MGARLMSLVLSRWTFVSSRAFRVLVRMAHTALDEPSPKQSAGMYFGGRDLLALTLSEYEDSNPRARYRTVSRALAELVEVGAIERSGIARAGQNQVYVLRLESQPRRNREGVSTGHPKGVSDGHAEGVPTRPARVSSTDAPRNHEEPVEEEEGEEQSVDLRTAVTVVAPAEPEKSATNSGCDKGCAKGFLLVGDMIERCECNNVIPFPAKEAS
jgi:hypothetical protein